MEPNNGTLYAFIDTIAKAIIQVVIFRHDAAAIRFFGDVASDPNSIVHKHITDYQLVQLGTLNLNNEITGTNALYDKHDTDQAVIESSCIITGRTWAAAQQQQEPA